MKTVIYDGHQGDVCIFEVDSFPIGKQIQDELTIKSTIALGEMSGHAHYFSDPSAVDIFKMSDDVYSGLTFVAPRREATLTHGLIKGFIGKEADQDYHKVENLSPAKKYILGIVQETDWLTKTIRKVVD